MKTLYAFACMTSIEFTVYTSTFFQIEFEEFIVNKNEIWEMATIEWKFNMHNHTSIFAEFCLNQMYLLNGINSLIESKIGWLVSENFMNKINWKSKPDNLWSGFICVLAHGKVI